LKDWQGEGGEKRRRGERKKGKERIKNPKETYLAFGCGEFSIYIMEICFQRVPGFPLAFPPGICID